MSRPAPETINVAPDWRAAMQIYILVLENGNETGKAAARADLLELAVKLDKMNEAEEPQANDCEHSETRTNYTHGVTFCLECGQNLEYLRNV